METRYFIVDDFESWQDVTDRGTRYHDNPETGARLMAHNWTEEYSMGPYRVVKVEGTFTEIPVPAEMDEVSRLMEKNAK